MKTRLNFTGSSRLRAALFSAVAMGALAVQSAFAANGTANFLDNNGTANDFGAPLSGAFTLSSTWSTSSAGTATPATFAANAQMTFGAAVGDSKASGTYTVTAANTVTSSVQGIQVNSTGANVTVNWVGNMRQNAGTTWYVNTGSTLSLLGNANNGGFNHNNNTTTFLGGGTIVFSNAIGANAQTAAQVVNMTNGTIKLAQTVVGNYGGGSGAGVPASFALTAGALQFLSASALGDAFFNFTNGGVSTVSFGSLNNPSIDNLSGSAGTLCVGGSYNPTSIPLSALGKYLFAGNWTFVGSSSLSLTNAVNLTANSVLTISASTLTISGPITGNSVLTTAGAGTLSLGTSGSIGGGATVRVGVGSTLDVSAVTGGFNLGSGGTLGGFGTINGNVTVPAGATLSPGASPGTNTFANNLTLSGGTNVFELDTTATGNNDLIIVSGNLTLSGTSTIRISAYNGSLSAGTYKLITYAGTLTGGTNNLTLVGVSANGTRQTFTLDATTAGEIDLIVAGTAASTTWNNAGATGDGATWDLVNNQNWSNSGTPDQFFNGDAVTFNDSNNGNYSVTISGFVNPGTVTVNNNSGDYTFTGSGTNTFTSLTKTGSSKLTLSESGDLNGPIAVNGGNLTFSESGAVNGNLTVNGGTATLLQSGTIAGTATIGSGGTVQVGNGGTAGVLPTGTVTMDGTLVLNRSDDNQLDRVIAGAGTGNLVKDGPNATKIYLANTYNGATTIRQGVILVSNIAAFGVAPGGAVTISNGATMDVGGFVFTNVATGFNGKQFFVSGAGVGGNGAIVNNSAQPGAVQQNILQKVTLTANATVGGQLRWDLRNNSPVLDLAGFTLTKTGPNQISVVAANVTSGDIDIQQGILSFETSTTVGGTGTITVRPGGFLGQFRNVPGTFTRPIVLNGGTLTNLSSTSANATNDSPITLTANSTLLSSSGLFGSEWLNGPISESGGSYGLTKLGTGTFILTNTVSYSGNTVIGNGVLGLSGGASLANSANIIVANGAVFDVSGMAAPFALGSGQTLSNSTSTAVLNGSSGTGSGTISLTYGSGTPSFIQTNGTLTLSSGTTLKVNNTGAALTANQYKVISKATTGTAGSVSGTAPSSVTVTGGGIAANTAAFPQIIGNELFLVVNHSPVIASIVTNTVNAGLTWKIAISALASAAGWSDPESDSITLSTVGPTSANSVSVTKDASFVYYNAPLNADDSFTYTIGDGHSTANGTVVLTVANNNAPTFNITGSVVNNDNSITLNGASIPGRTNIVQWTADLTPPISWTPIGTNVVGPNGLWNFTTDPAQPNPSYYRAVTQP